MGIFFSERCLGVDIGTSAIKLVELSKSGKKIKLENYGLIKNESLYKSSFRLFEKNSFSLSFEEIVKAIQALIKETKIKTKKMVIAIPDFLTFFISFTLPPLNSNELPLAIEARARPLIPLPISEVILDWHIIEGHPTNKNKEPTKIILMAIPKETINQYQQIAELTNHEIIALQPEAFTLSRALAQSPEGKETVLIIDVGTQSTMCNIVEKGILKSSFSIDLGGNQFVEKISRALNLDLETAQMFIEKYGITEQKEIRLNGEAIFRKILLPFIDIILGQAQIIIKNFEEKEKKNIDKIILSGGGAFLPGLVEYFCNNTKKEVKIINSLCSVSYPELLKERLEELGPIFSISLGAALFGLK